MDAEAIWQRIDALTEVALPALKTVDVTGVLRHPAKPPQFVWDGYLPKGVVTLFSAHGGTGKSTVALMLAVAAATGRPLFNVGTNRCKTLFVSLEDSESVVRYRLAQICNEWVIDPAELEGWLTIVDGTEYPELFTSEGRGAGATTQTFDELTALAAEQAIGLLIVDNASDAYGGDEIQRRQVRAFMRSIGSIAKQYNCAVLLLAHVDKQTSRNKAESGEGYSGSTAWHNSARSRLFMSRDKNGLLLLEHQKSNFGKMSDKLTLCWLHGKLPDLEGNAPDDQALIDKVAGRADDESAARLLRMINEYESRGHYCSPKSTSPTNPYKVLLPDPAFKRLSLRRDDVTRIITQCQRAGWLEILSYRSKDRKDLERWTLTELGKNYAEIALAPTAPTSIDNAVSTGVEPVAPTAPTCVGGVGGERAHIGGVNQLDDGLSGNRTHKAIF